MRRIPVERFSFPPYDDQDVIAAWEWFMSFISVEDWQQRKAAIEAKMTVEFRTTDPFSESLSEGTLMVEKKDVMGWYLYLVDVLLHEPQKYEFFQGARVIPIFKRLGADLNLIKRVGGIEKRVRDLLKKRRSEADALLFELLTALLWARNGYDVLFLDEANDGKTPDLLAKKGDDLIYIECKRQTKTSDYTYRESKKRQDMISHINQALVENNILLDIVFHVELHTLPDTFLKDILEKKLLRPVAGNVVSTVEVDVNLSFVDIPAIRRHLDKFSVKYPSPVLNSLIGRKPVDNLGFTSGMLAKFYRVGDGEFNNLYVEDLSNAYGVFWHCDAPEAIWAKARDIKNQVNAAISQFGSEYPSVIHIGMETFDGPDIERQRFDKIKNTIEQIAPETTTLRWLFCHFFQAYSPPDSNWIFDETVSTISPYLNAHPPLDIRHLVIPEDSDMADNISHWERPLP